tara:strand:- start:1196 stop:1909 length:714 start_codon:yes stop_codon:yes gene_type:complete
MAFKLKSPFHKAEVKTVAGVEYGNKRATADGSQRVQGMESSMFNPTADGEQELKTETNPKDQVDDQVDKADKGVPLGLNPKQQAKFETRKYKKGLRQASRERKQTEKAKRIYERNQFEAVGKDGAYVDPDKAAGIKSDRAEKELEQKNMQRILESNLPLAEREKQINAIRSKSKFFEGNILDPATKMLNMEKPNRAGGPIKMLKSMEDNTPAKYKSVKKTARENLMSSLAKKGEPYE